MIGRIIKTNDGYFDTVTESGEKYFCRLKGIFRRKKQKPLAGDLVVIETDENDRYEEKTRGIISEILPRHNYLNRPPIANLNVLFIVMSVASPPPNLLLTDKITVTACFNKIKPVIVINKTDLSPPDSLREIYEKTGFDIIATSLGSFTADDFNSHISGNICAFAGSSGVGKSSILNMLLPDIKLEVGEVKRKMGTGKHTTKSVELFSCGEKSYIADTPGFNLIDFIKHDLCPREELIQYFPDLYEYADDCKYSKCSHRTEDGCSVLTAVAAGRLSLTRHEHYIFMYNELSQINAWEKKSE